MRLPFFKSAKPESDQSGKVLITPPRPGLGTPPTVARSEVALRVKPQTPSLPKPSVPSVAGANGGATASTIPIPLRSILSQLPSQLFTPGSELQVADATLDIPSNLILPKLRTGRIDIRLADLLPLLPQDALRQPIGGGAEQQTIILPLGEVVAAVPPDALTVRHESTLEVDTDGLDKFPDLFTEGLFQSPASETQPIAVSPAIIEQQPPAAPVAETPAPSPTAQLSEPAKIETPAPSTAPAVAESDLPAGLPETVMVSVRSLVSVLPDHVLAAPRAELQQRADFDSKVAMPLAPILPQLKTGRVRLPTETIIAALPASLILSPLPKIAGETVALSIAEIIPQLPPQAFMAQLRQTQDKEVEINETDIPTPFAERGDDREETQPETVEAAAEITSAKQLEDESVAIFAEKTTAPAAQPVIEPVAEPVTQPVTEPISEPVAETSPEVSAPEPIEAVIEPTAPVVAEEAVTVTEEAAAPVEPAVEPVAEQTVEPVVESVVAPPEPVEVEAVSETVPLAASASEQESPVAPLSTTRDEAGFLVDINACTVEDLKQFEGIGRALATRIVEFRNAHGAFSSLEDLRAIPGIGRKTFRAIAGVEARALNQLLGVEHNQELTLQEIVRRTSALPGITGCILAMSDGLLLTGQLPEQFDQNAISVFAPQLFKKVGRYARELRVGQIRRLTIFTDQQPVSIFQAGEIFLVIIHDTRHFSKALLRRCERISQEIAHLCRQRAVV